MPPSTVAEQRSAVLGALGQLKPPVHIAALAVAYKSAHGCTIKDSYKGGMLRFVKAELADEVVLKGEGNDTFVQLRTPAARAANWICECVEVNGPILVSMVGRLYQEAHGRPFAQDGFPEGIGRFMRERLREELVFEPQKGQEVLVEMRRRGDARAFLGATSKKLRKQGAHGGEGEDGEDGTSRLAMRGSCAAAYSVPSERVLIVGEADFSWSASLVADAAATGGGAESGGGDATPRRRRLACTSFDSLPTLRVKYGAAVDAHLRALKASGASALHGIDATGLSREEALRARGPFEVIAFHFPHVGGDGGLASSIDENRKMLGAFLDECAQPAVLSADGEVHVTLVHRYPYTAWLAGVRGSGRGGSSHAAGVCAGGSAFASTSCRAGANPAGGSAGGSATGAAPAAAAIQAAKAAGAEAARRAVAAAKAAKAAATEAEAAAAAQAKEEAKVMAKAASAALRQATADAAAAAAPEADAADGGTRGAAAAEPHALVYVGAEPFEFGAFPAYKHQATSKVDNGALDVATRCLTHVWCRQGASRATAAEMGRRVARPAKTAVEAARADSSRAAEAAPETTAKPAKAPAAAEAAPELPPPKKKKKTKVQMDGEEESAKGRKKRRQED